jgi:hypothetical protein
MPHVAIEIGQGLALMRLQYSVHIPLHYRVPLLGEHLEIMRLPAAALLCHMRC